MKKATLFSSLFVISCITTTTGLAWADVQPGDTITTQNIAQAEALLTPSTRWMVERGMPIQVIATKKVSWPKAYQDATEKFAAQVELADDGKEILNYVAGLPFPTIDLSDSLAAYRIMWNLHFPPVDNLGGEMATHFINRHGEIEKTIEHPWRAMKWLGRVFLDPKPLIPHNPALHYSVLSGPYTLPHNWKDISVLYFRYLARDIPDDTYAYSPEVRRVYRVSEANRSDAMGGGDYDVDSFYWFNAKISNWDFRVLAEKDMLAVVHSGKYADPTMWCAPRDGKHGILAALPCVSWEKRRVWVIEAIPTGYPRDYHYSKRLLYVDQDFFGTVLEEMYDTSGELWKAQLFCLYYTKQPYPGYPANPLDGAKYNYTDEWFFVPNTVLVDLQEVQATVVEVPPSHKRPAEWNPDWYFNEAVSNNTPEIYSQSYLSRSGR